MFQKIWDAMPDALKTSLKNTGWAFAVFVLGYISTQYGIQGKLTGQPVVSTPVVPAPVNTDNYILVPGGMDLNFIAGEKVIQAKAGAHSTNLVIHPILHRLMDVRAGREYQKAHPELTFEQAIKLAEVVPESAILDAAAAQKLDMTNMPSVIDAPTPGTGILAKIFAWLSSPQGQAFIKLILSLIPLFAENSISPAWPQPPPHDLPRFHAFAPHVPDYIMVC